MVNTVNNNQGANKAFSNLVQNSSALKSTTAEGATGPALKRLYVNSRGDVRQSSNAISHAFRKLLGKPVGDRAVAHALTQQVGEKESQRLLANLNEAAGNLRTLGDIDDVLTGNKSATWDSTKLALNEDTGEVENLQVEDFDDDAALQATIWQKFKNEDVDPSVPLADPTDLTTRAYEKLTPKILSNLINAAAQEADQIAKQEGSRIDFGAQGIAGSSTAGFAVKNANAFLYNNTSLVAAIEAEVSVKIDNLPLDKQDPDNLKAMIDEPGIVQPMLYRALINDLLSLAEPKTNRRVS